MPVDNGSVVSKLSAADGSWPLVTQHERPRGPRPSRACLWLTMFVAVTESAYSAGHRVSDGGYVGRYAPWASSLSRSTSRLRRRRSSDAGMDRRVRRADERGARVLDLRYVWQPDSSFARLPWSDNEALAASGLRQRVPGRGLG